MPRKAAATPAKDQRVEELEKKVLHLNEKVSDLGESTNKILDILQSGQAPASVQPRVEADEYADRSFVREMEETDEGVVIAPGPLNLDHPAMKDRLEYERFLQEEVEVEIHTTSDALADQIFDVAVNGRSVTFRRGETKRVKRYIVEGLARAKPIHYTNEEYLNARGEQSVRWPARQGLRYGFSVVNDTARGKAWLKSILAQP